MDKKDKSLSILVPQRAHALANEADAHFSNTSQEAVPSSETDAGI